MNPILERRTALVIVSPFLALMLGAPSVEAASDTLWGLLRGGGQVVVMRHATTTPGAGDPAGFRLDDCSTQRNLTDAGRDEARRVGTAFRAHGIPVASVRSSRWCRCLETARLAFGRVEPWSPLDSIFRDRSGESEQTRAVGALAGERPDGGNLILVTHGVNILALTGILPAPGEFGVLTPEGGGRFHVAGRLAPAALE